MTTKNKTNNQINSMSCNSFWQLKGPRNQGFYCYKISQMNTNHYLRKNDVMCAFREFIMNFIGKWQPLPRRRAASHRKGAPMRRNRELGNLFQNLSFEFFFLRLPFYTVSKRG